MQEYIYIFSNPAMPGLIKVGRTNDPQRRLGELYNTSAPAQFEVEFCAKVPDSDTSERAAHRALLKYRYNTDREFFAIEAAKAVEIIIPAIGEHVVTYARSDHGAAEVVERFRQAEEDKKRKADEARKSLELEKARRQRKVLAIINHLQGRREVARNKLTALGNRPRKEQLGPIGQLCASIWSAEGFFPTAILIAAFALSYTSIREKYAEYISLASLSLISTAIIAGVFFKKVQNANNKEFEMLVAPFLAYEAELDTVQKAIDYVTSKEIDGLDSKSGGYLTDEEIDNYLSSFDLAA